MFIKDRTVKVLTSADMFAREVTTAKAWSANAIITYMTGKARNTGRGTTETVRMVTPVVPEVVMNVGRDGRGSETTMTGTTTAMAKTVISRASMTSVMTG